MRHQDHNTHQDGGSISVNREEPLLEGTPSRYACKGRLRTPTIARISLSAVNLTAETRSYLPPPQVINRLYCSHSLPGSWTNDSPWGSKGLESGVRRAKTHIVRLIDVSECPPGAGSGTRT